MSSLRWTLGHLCRLEKNPNLTEYGIVLTMYAPVNDALPVYVGHPVHQLVYIVPRLWFRHGHSLSDHVDQRLCGNKQYFFSYF